MTFSSTLDKKGSLEIGLKFERTETSKFGFLINGCTIACLKGTGKSPELKQA